MTFEDNRKKLVYFLFVNNLIFTWNGNANSLETLDKEMRTIFWKLLIPIAP